MRKRDFILTVTLLAVILTSCSEKPNNPVGFRLVDEDGHWQVDRATIQEVLADSCFHVTLGSGIGPYLLVGSWEGQEARSLISFEDLPDTLSLSLTGAKLTLTAYTETQEDSMLISGHAIQNAWNDSTVTWEHPWNEAGGDFDAEVIAQGSYAIIEGTLLELDFSEQGVDLVRGWLGGQANNGIILRALDPEVENLKYFYSRWTAYDPVLTLTFATGDTSDTSISVESNKNALIAQPVVFPGEDLLCVSDGFIYRTWLQFDLPAIPESAFVNLATLSLTVSEFHAPLDNMTVGAYSVSDFETLDFSPTLYGYANLFSGKTLMEIDISVLVQKWIYGAENAGVLLRTYPEYGDLSRALFFSSVADSVSRPTLTIVYTQPPGGNLTGQVRERVIP
jgi:hypothetical protein